MIRKLADRFTGVSTLNILSSIHSPDDVKALESAQLPTLCAEIREYLIDSLSHTGGHLAANLGVVELTVALHRVYDPSRDRLLFDVGHQCYTHKLLTGRRERFDTLRRLDGLSGFPKPCESVCDAFVAGHASASVSVALGMARARTLLRESYDVVVVIGDGALSGGLAYEGLSDAGESGEPLVVILNDNGMSINPNVGGVARLLAKLRTRPGYLSFKRVFRRIVGKVPPVYNAAHNFKEWLKDRLLPANMFDDMGFYYIGPVDGHDAGRLELLIRWARELQKPVLLHVVTTKGKGCAFAEECPETYHGVGPFDPDTGAVKSSGKSFSEQFGAALCSLAAADRKICAVTAAMESGTGLTGFAEKFPRRFFDVGIAEGHAVSMSAGLAKQGLTPVFAVYSSFLQRAYDMLVHDVSLLGLHVVLAVDRAGIVGRDGETHHGVFDVSFLCSIPHMTVYCPASFRELRDMLELALYAEKGPVALRYPRGGEGEYRESHAQEASTVLREGSTLTMVSYGRLINEVIAAARLLESRGVSAEIIKLNRINPLEADAVMRSLEKTRRLLVAEDVCRAGSVGSRLLAEAAERGLALGSARLLDLGSGIAVHGGIRELLHRYGLDGTGIAEAAVSMLPDMKRDA